MTTNTTANTTMTSTNNQTTNHEMPSLMLNSIAITITLAVLLVVLGIGAQAIGGFGLLIVFALFAGVALGFLMSAWIERS